MGKKSPASRRAPRRPLESRRADVPVVAGREPCPCGSGRRYKACHGRAAGAGRRGLRRPAVRGAGRASATGSRCARSSRPRPPALTLAGEQPASPATLATVLPMAWPGLVRQDGEVFVGLQVPGGSGDASRDVARRLGARAGRPSRALRSSRPPLPGPGSAAAGPARPGGPARRTGARRVRLLARGRRGPQSARWWRRWSGPTRPPCPRCG